MSDTTIIVILVIVIIIALIFIFTSIYDRKQKQKLSEYVASKGYTFYKGDTIKLRDDLQKTLFYNTARKPIPYNIIDTGWGKLVKMQISGARMSFTYTVFVDRVTCPDVMITPRTLTTGFMYNPGGFREIFIEGLSVSHIVFCRDSDALLPYIKDIAVSLSQVLDNFSVEVSNKVFVCYDYKNRPKLKHYDYYIAKCLKIRNILTKNDTK